MLTDEEQRNLYSRNIASFVRDGVVDWENIEKLRKNMRGGTYSEEFYNKILNNLQKRGVISDSPNGNIMVCDESGLNLGPSFFSPLYFTREEDAERYKEVRYKNAQYSVNIWKINFVNSK